MKNFINFFTTLSLIFSSLLPLAGRAGSGVTMSLSPSSLTIKQGSEFTVSLVLQAPEKSDAFNAAEATLGFPVAKLQVVSLSKSGSVFGLWSSEPTFSNSAGTISFTGGRTSGFSGSATALTIKFKALTAGNAAVTLANGQVAAADGKGTNILSNFVPGAYAVSNSAGYVSLEAGDLIKLPDDKNPKTTVDSAVYYYAADGLRYVFPNSKTYFTWYKDFNGVKEVGAEQLGTIGIGGNVTYRPGLRMVKIESDPKVYAIDRLGARRYVATEAVAVALYGSNWNKMIDDVPDAFFSNYPEGAALTAGASWTATAATGSVTSISADKALIGPLEVTLQADGSFSPAAITVPLGRTVRFTNATSGPARLASNPHPIHTDLPGFDSAVIPVGLNYVYRFTKAGAFTYHNHNATSKTGTVTVTP